jgi:hypothetical protein
MVIYLLRAFGPNSKLIHSSWLMVKWREKAQKVYETIGYVEREIEA